MSIRNLTYNNNTVENVVFNNSAVDIVKYNETTVYDNTSQDIVFEVYPEFVPHDNIRLQPYIPYNSSSYTIPTAYLLGQSNFFVRIKQQNAGDITINNEGWLDCVYKIDNYGYGFFRYYGYGIWIGGGWSNIQQYRKTITFTPSADYTLAKSLPIQTNVDEDNTVFFKGMFTGKLIRIPSSGISSYLTVQFYPYTFDDGFFYEQTRLARLDVSSVGQTVDGALVKSGTINFVSPSDNGTFLATDIVNSGLEARVNYSTGANTTGQYRYAFLHFDRGNTTSVTNMHGVEAHFIQEPYSANRIYYGNVPQEAKFWEPYVDTPVNTLKYHNIFQYANSEIVSGTKQFIMNSSGNTSDRHNVICVPAALSYTITPNSYSTLAESYMWGEQAYNIYKMTGSGNITYTLQIN